MLYWLKKITFWREFQRKNWGWRHVLPVSYSCAQLVLFFSKNDVVFHIKPATYPRVLLAEMAIRMQNLHYNSRRACWHLWTAERVLGAGGRLRSNRHRWRPDEQPRPLAHPSLPDGGRFHRHDNRAIHHAGRTTTTRLQYFLLFGFCWLYKKWFWYFTILIGPFFPQKTVWYVLRISVYFMLPLLISW